MDAEDTLSKADQNVKEHIDRFFTPTDNLRRDYESEKRSIFDEKASILIHNAIDTGIMAPLLGRGQPLYGGWTFELKEPIHAKINRNYDGLQDVTFNKVLLSKKYIPCEDGLPPTTKDKLLGTYIQKPVRLVPSDCDQNNPSLPVPYNAQDELQKQTLFEICFGSKNLERYARYVLWYFNYDLRAYGPFKLSSGSSVFPFAFKPPYKCAGVNLSENALENSSDDDLKNSSKNALENLKDDEKIQKIRSFVFENDRFGKQSQDLLWLETLYGEQENSDSKDREAWRPVMRNPGMNGTVRQTVFKIFHQPSQTKLLFPFTNWRQKGSTENFIYCCPSVQPKQDLYDLDRLDKHPELPVILTDSIEIADLNRRHPNTGFIWTSWLGEEEGAEFVDWSPLKGRTVFYLVTPHSGLNWLEVCSRAKQVAEFVEEDAAKIDFVFLPVDYPETDGKHFNSLEEFMDFQKSSPPKVLTNDMTIYSKEDFYDYINDMEAKQQKRLELEEEINKGYKTAPPSKEETEANEDETDERKTWLLRPLLFEGRLSMLIADPEGAKTSFALSICAALIADEPTDLVRGQWWLPPKSTREKGSVLYLDFESLGDEEEMQDKLIKCMNPYLPETKKFSIGKKNRKNGPDNFKVVSFKEKLELAGDWFKNNDPTKSPAHQKILNEISQFQKKQEPENPLRLVVFDNWNGMVGTYEGYAWDNTLELFKKINEEGVAVLLVHHTNQEGESEGTKRKLQSVRQILKISNPKPRGERDLADPVTLSFGKSNVSGMPPHDRQKVTIHIPKDEERWTVYGLDDKALEDRQLWRFGKTQEFLKRRFNSRELANALGYGHDTYSKYLQKYNERKDELEEEFGNK